MTLVAAYSSESEEEQDVAPPPAKRIRRKQKLLNADQAFASTDTKFLRESEKKTEQDQAEQLRGHDHVPAANAAEGKTAANEESQAADAYGVPAAGWHVPLTFVDLVKMEKERAKKEKSKKKRQGEDKVDEAHQPREKRRREKKRDEGGD